MSIANLGFGSTFHFHRPARHWRGRRGEGIYHRARPAEPARHRGADDNPTAREILRIYLESFSFRVDEAANADELFQRMETAQEDPTT